MSVNDLFMFLFLLPDVSDSFVFLPIVGSIIEEPVIWMNFSDWNWNNLILEIVLDTEGISVEFYQIINNS